MTGKKWEKIIQAYALKNAIEHNGKAVQGSILAGLFHEGLKKTEVKKIMPVINKILNQINNLGLEEQKKTFKALSKNTSKRKIRKGLPELPGAKKGKVLTRFSPFPSGPLHIGNARTAVLNFEYAKKYKGKMLLVIDDTIGSEEKPIAKEAYKLIPEGLDWLGLRYKKLIIYKSDRLEIYYKYAEKLIRKGKAYVCNCKKEEIRENRIKMRECSCRQFGIESQLKRWEKMFLPRIKPGEAVLRIKTSMQHANPAFRDRVLFRISDRKHQRVGNKYRVWPMLEFSWAIDDHLLKTTHIIRGKELRIESDIQKFIWDIFKWKQPVIIYNGHLSVEGIKISKSKSQKEVKSGAYLGWDDPRTWSLGSLEKRGIQAEALRKFLLEFGVTEREVEASVEILYAKNREIVHEIAERVSFMKSGGKKGNAKIIMPDGKIIKGQVESVKKLKKTIYYLLNFGYCNLVKLGRINEFYFTHV